MGMNVKREMPEEVKNQIMPDGKKRVITEKLPENHLKDIQEAKKKKQNLLNDYLRASIQVTNNQLVQQEKLKQIKDVEVKIGKVVEHAFKKMKLGKQKARRWQFRQDSFVGVYNPPRKPTPKPTVTPKK